MKRILGIAVLASAFVASAAMADGSQSMRPLKPSTGLSSGGMIAGPPANDECTSVSPVTLSNGIPVVFTGDNTGATEDCGGALGNSVWEGFVVPGPDCMNTTLNYCGTGGGTAWGNAWLVAVGPTADCTDCNTGPVATFDVTTCGDDNVTMNWLELRPGTYYYPVMNDPDNNSVGAYNITVVGVTTVCNILDPVPTVSQWGLIVMGLLLLIAGTVVIRRRLATVETAGA